MDAGRRLRRAGPPAALVVLVGALSLAAHARLGVGREALAASPARTAEGKVWLLFSSGLIVDHPVAISLLSFAALAAAVFVVGGPRIFWLAAALGHIASTLLVYLFIALSRTIDPSAWSRVMHAPDYGVSAISAAWLGAIAALSWREPVRGRFGRAAIATGCAAVGLFAYSLRPDVTILSSEHLVAFALGILLASPEALSPLGRRLAALRARVPAGADPIAAGATTLAVGIVAAALTPAALGDLTEQLSRHHGPSTAACTASWNRSRQAPRTAAPKSPTAVFVATTRESLHLGGHRSKWADYCTYAFSYPGGRMLYVEAVWRHGNATRWRTTELRDAPAATPSDVTLSRTGVLHTAV